MAPMPRIQLPNGNASIKGTTNNFLYAETMSGDSSPTPSSPPSSTAGVAKSQCSSLSDGESFEGYGENEYPTQLREGRSSNSNGSNNNSNLINNNNDNLSVGNVSSQHNHSEHSNDGNNNLNGSNGIELDLAPHVGSSTPQDSGRRQISSNALASQLYRSSSFNSSGRSSNCDTTEDMYSDISLENRHDYDYRVSTLIK
uniref:Uncharacterized protein n=1 Tax=Drosophila rhopaloa TaxID=1041015 RepID=A0A6P4E0D5_DRORH